MNSEKQLQRLMREDPVGVNKALRKLRALMPLEEKIFTLIQDGKANDSGQIAALRPDHGRTVIASRLKIMCDLGYLARTPHPDKPVGYIYTLAEQKPDERVD